jgi:acid phosphatase class B
MPDIILEGDHPRIISVKFGWDWLCSFRGEDFIKFHPRSPTKMATTVQLCCYWKQLWSRWAILLNIPKQLAKSIIYMSTLIWKKGKYIVKRTGRARKWPLWPGDHYTKVTVRAGLTVFSIIEKIGCFKQEYPHMLFLWKVALLDQSCFQ